VIDASEVGGIKILPGTAATTVGKIPISQGDGSAIFADPFVQGVFPPDTNADTGNSGGPINPVLIGARNAADAKLKDITCDAAGNIGVNVASSALAVGAATAANQATEITGLAAIVAALAATLKMNLAQIAGTATSVGTGASDAGTQRVAACNPVIKTISVSAPAAGAAWTATPPAGKQWIIIALSYIFTASATAATRTLNIFTNTSGNAWFVDLARNGITASQAPRVNAFSGGQLSTDILTGNLQIFLSLPPGLIIDSGDVLNGSAANIQTTDQFSNIFLKVIEQ
jgi:hypothetical protein